MRNRTWNTEQYPIIQDRRFRRSWKKVTAVLSCVVVLLTIGALTFPAITMNRDACSFEEHQHSDACYGPSGETLLSCPLEVHRHSGDCYDGSGALICGEADFVLHVHDQLCCNAEGTIVCTLPVGEEHWHDGSCWQTPELLVDPGHTHEDDCYEWVPSEVPACGKEVYEGHSHSEGCLATGSELICTQTVIEAHTHSEGCYATETVPVCGQEGVEGHVHETVCYAETSSLVCGLEETQGHSHGESCYATAGTPICGIAEDPGHQHSEDCYPLVQGSLICGEEAREPVTQPGEPELVCGKVQAGLHDHDDSCRSESGVTCGTLHAASHQHTDSCFQEGPPVLVCTIPEHFHTDSCIQATEDGETVPETTQATETIPQTTAAEETVPVTTFPDETVPATTVSEETTPETTVPGETTSETTVPGETVPSTTEPSETAPTAVDPAADAAAIIAGLPPIEEIQAEISRLTEAGDAEALAAYEEKIRSAVAAAFECYRALTPEQQAAVTNAADLDQYAYLLEEEDAPGAQEYTASAGSVTAAATIDPALVPEGTAFYAAAIPEGSEAYTAAAAQAEAYLLQSGFTLLDYTLLDLHFADGDGAEVSIAGQTEVSLTFAEPILPGAEKVCVLHITADAVEDVTGTITKGEAGVTALTIVTDGFSPFLTASVEAQDLTADEQSVTDPFELTGSYIDGSTLSYKNTEGVWVEINDSTGVVPGDAEVKLDIHFYNIAASELLAHEGQLVYTLPSLLRNPVATGIIQSGGTTVATIVCDGTNKVHINFDTDWLAKQGNNLISGDFTVTSKFNIQKFPESGKDTITVGVNNFVVDLGSDFLAEYGDIALTKALTSTRVIEDETGQYLEYILTVAVGSQGGTHVVVKDIFRTEAIQYIDSYATGAVETSNQGTFTAGQVTVESGDSGPGTLVWTIGDMAPNEVRTLTYRVKLKDKYVGGYPYSTSLPNDATVYMGATEAEQTARETDTVIFTPMADGDMHKSHIANIQENDDGSRIITYVVWVSAEAGNNYTLKDVLIKDGLAWGGTAGYDTDDALLDYVSFVEGSFQLYQGSYTHGGTSNVLLENVGKLTQSGDDFMYNVGDLAPGEKKTLVYQVKVDPGVYAAAGNSTVNINNRCEFHPGEGYNQAPSNSWFEAYTHQVSFNRKNWTRKIQGEPLEASSTIPLTGSVYDVTTGTLSPIDSPEASFTVPAGSYGYTVLVNEAGDWDVSGANFTDSLNSVHMLFQGYAKIEAYAVTSAPAHDSSNGTAESTLTAGTPAGTAWVKIDGLQSFSFTPVSLGLPQGGYGYRITYYAAPEDMAGVSTIQVSNTFGLSGPVGYGAYTYSNVSATASTSATLTGGSNFSAVKEPWYYDAAANRLYWVIKIDGTTIPAGTGFKDVRGENNHVLGGSGYIDAYIAPSGLVLDETVTVSQFTAEYEDGLIYEYQDQGIIFKSSKAEQVRFWFNEAVTIPENHSIYVLMQTTPTSPPDAKGEYATYNNKLQQLVSGTPTTGDDIYQDLNTASQTLYGGGSVYKTPAWVRTYDGSGGGKVVTSGVSEVFDSHDTSLLQGVPGTYVAWHVVANYEGRLSGDYILEETIPDGMELSYIRLFNTDAGCVRTMDPGDGWTAVTAEAMTYYVNGQQAKWQVSLETSDTPQASQLVFRVVCRVTDPRVLQGGEEVEFSNRVSLKDLAGQELDSDVSPVSIQCKTIGKKNLHTDANGSTVPFRLTINDLGEDLIADAQTIVLVDEMSAALILDPTSIQVTNTSTGAPITQFHIALEDGADGTHILRLTLPDDQPLTIQYNCRVSLPPGISTTISNKAYWEGYTSTDESYIPPQDFSYDVSGSVTTNEPPVIQVLKLDRNNVAVSLKGAVFRLDKVEFSENGTPPVVETVCEKTTDDAGLIYIGSDASDVSLHWNTYYQLTETAAPDGYILESDPIVVVFAKADENGSYATFPYADKIIYDYDGHTLQLPVYNSKGTAQVRKAFLDAGGQSIEKVDGTYRFGIYYKDTDGTLIQHQVQTLILANGGGGLTATFTDLTSGMDYWIYELDDNGERIGNDSVATVSGKDFIVTYGTDDPIQVTIENGVQQTTPSVTVTNQVFYTELPQTGGPGTARTLAPGLLLMALSGLGWLVLSGKPKKRKGAR